MSRRAEQVANGVWRCAGDIRGSMNVFFLADRGGVTMFDAGTRPMTRGVAEAAAALGGLRRIVLGHSHPDHRGTAPGLGVPVLCHPDEVADAEGDGGYRHFDLDQVDWWLSRRLYPYLLRRRWDGGPVEIAGTVEEGEEVAGFEVVHLPGHAPGLIALWREADGLALVSDVLYMVDSIRLRALPEDEAPTVPHRLWATDFEQSIESVRKLAALGPRTIWTGHEHAIAGDPAEVRDRLERAAQRAAG